MSDHYDDVTVVIPVYCNNLESLSWLRECVESAVAQQCKVVLYDDGSSLDIVPVVRNYPVRAFRGSRNVGVSYARNKAISYADTDYILPLDCDDRLVNDAVEKLYSAFQVADSTPAYSDIHKFGIENDEHFVLLDFDCYNLLKYVGFTSVNVFHSKEQWKSIGGYDESLEFFEDGEYNARLLGTYCGVHVKEPLVEYRMHGSQRTRLYEKQSRYYAETILERIRRYDMACAGCSGRRRSPSNMPDGLSREQVIRMSQQAPRETVQVDIKGAIATAPATLPLEFEGKVLCVYIGGQGRAKHYYQGIVSKQPQKVTFGDYVYVDPRDARNEEDMNTASLYVRVKKNVQEAPKPIESVAPQAVASAPVAETSETVEIEEIVPEVRQSRIAPKTRAPKKKAK